MEEQIRLLELMILDKQGEDLLNALIRAILLPDLILLGESALAWFPKERADFAGIFPDRYLLNPFETIKQRSTNSLIKTVNSAPRKFQYNKPNTLFSRELFGDAKEIPMLTFGSDKAMADYMQAYSHFFEFFEEPCTINSHLHLSRTQMFSHLPSRILPMEERQISAKLANISRCPSAASAGHGHLWLGSLAIQQYDRTATATSLQQWASSFGLRWPGAGGAPRKALLIARHLLRRRLSLLDLSDRMTPADAAVAAAVRRLVHRHGGLLSVWPAAGGEARAVVLPPSRLTASVWTSARAPITRPANFPFM
jgi:hypothetical protein